MSSTPQTVTIYDNSGNTVLWDSETEGVYLPYTIYLVVDDGSYSVQFYDLELNQLGATQSFDYTSLGFATSAGSSTVDYPFNGEPVEVDLTEEGLSLYLVEQSTPSPVNYRPLSYVDAKIQVDSAIRDANGVRIDTNYQKKPEVIEYTVPTTVASGSYRVIAEYNGTYDGSPGYVKFAMEVTSSSYEGIYVIEATWGQASGGITLLSGNVVYTDAGYVSLYYPSSTSNYAYPPLLAVYNGSTREKQVKITILESSGNLTWKTDWNTEVSTTGRSNQNLGLYYRSQVYYATSASSASSATSSTITTEQRKNRFIGETAQLYSLCGVATDGKVYRLLSIPSPYHLALPARLTSNYTSGSSANQSVATRDSYNSSIAYSYLANSTYQGGSGYTCPALTTSDGGRVLYVRGSLVTDTVNGVSSVNFVPDGNITLSMAPGYTYIPFGEVYRSSSSSAPSYFYWKFESTPAYTIDSNGKLTHIDGKPISNGITVSSSAPSGGSDGDIWIQY